ncbi:MAG: anthranilate phosphoribosyltransferase [Bergeyella sp.]|nr:anthranilate phosphoribosyltransferase [Bergeyella sp.]
MRQILEYLLDHQTLSKAEAQSILTEISNAKFSEAEVISFVTIFLMRSITQEEMEGFREALLGLSLRVDLETEDLVDIVGTGGDGKNTFNISTLSSFIVAGTGQKVAKQGNYGSSTLSGASNVLEKLGYTFKKNEKDLKRDLYETNICFLHAPLFHPALQNVAPLRKQLGIRTFFNLLGPLVNPAYPKYNLIGVANLEIARLYQYVTQKEKFRNFMLLHALDGYDEISLTGDTKIITQGGEKIKSAQDFHYKNISPNSIFGGDTLEEAAGIFLRILEGKGSEEQNAVVLANAAVALENTEKYGNYEECLLRAKESLFSFNALNCFKKAIK